MYIYVIFKLCLCMVTFISNLALGMAYLRFRRRQDTEGSRCLRLGFPNGMWQASLGYSRALLQGCGNSFEVTEMSCVGMVVVMRGSQLSVKTDLFSSKRDASALLRSLPCKMTCRMTHGIRISTQTIKYRLCRAGMRARRPAIRIPLT